MPLLRRMNILKELFKIRVGPGAAILPPDVTRIHLFFAKRLNNGHFGPRLFWREHLPRLKFHNPSVDVTVERTEDQSSPAKLTVHFGKEGAEGRTETIDVRHKHESEIYQRLLEVTKATEVEPTAEEMEQVKRYEQEAIDKAIDSKKKKAVMLQLREEARIERQMREAARAAA